MLGSFLFSFLSFFLLLLPFKKKKNQCYCLAIFYLQSFVVKLFRLDENSYFYYLFLFFWIFSPPWHGQVAGIFCWVKCDLVRIFFCHFLNDNIVGLFKARVIAGLIMIEINANSWEIDHEDFQRKSAWQFVIGISSHGFWWFSWFNREWNSLKAI